MPLLQSTMGWTRVRFRASVKAGARVRLRVTLMELEQQGASSRGFGQATADRRRSSHPGRSLRRVAAEGAGHRWARRKDILSRVVVSRDHEPTKVWCRVAADCRREGTHISTLHKEESMATQSFLDMIEEFGTGLG